MPELPAELEREIFELAFDSRDVKLKLKFCLVARRFQFWIDRLFYELVTLEDEERASRFFELIQSSAKPPDFFTAVKRLCFTVAVDGVTACSILAVCTKVESLACWVDSKHVPELSLFVSRLPLRRLCIEVNHFWSIPFTPSESLIWLSGLTHIDLVPWSEQPQPAHLSRLAYFPCLTHVCLYTTYMGAEHVAVVCSSCPRLRVLILLTDSFFPSSDLDQLANGDHRIVVQEEPYDVVGEWEAPYSGDSDMWFHAEETVEQRKALLPVGG